MKRAALFASRMSNPDRSGLLSYIPGNWSGWTELHRRLTLGKAEFYC
jgi:hypothetical protein